MIHQALLDTASSFVYTLKPLFYEFTLLYFACTMQQICSLLVVLLLFYGGGRLYSVRGVKITNRYILYIRHTCGTVLPASTYWYDIPLVHIFRD